MSIVPRGNGSSSERCKGRMREIEGQTRNTLFAWLAVLYCTEPAKVYIYPEIYGIATQSCRVPHCQCHNAIDNTALENCQTPAWQHSTFQVTTMASRSMMTSKSRNWQGPPCLFHLFVQSLSTKTKMEKMKTTRNRHRGRNRSRWGSELFEGSADLTDGSASLGSITVSIRKHRLPRSGDSAQTHSK